jgi:hypothetical protein
VTSAGQCRSSGGADPGCAQESAPVNRTYREARLSNADDLRIRVNRVVTMLAPHARGSGPIGDWRGLWLDVTLSIHELEACLMMVRKHMP